MGEYLQSESSDFPPERLFYRRTEDPKVLKFREELIQLSEDQIYERLMSSQADGKVALALECFDEIQRRRKQAAVDNPTWGI